MKACVTGMDRALWRAMRWLVWGGAAVLLALPWVAMRFPGTGVDWTGSDFAVMGVLLALVCVAFEVSVRVGRSNAYVLGAGLAVAAGFLITWSALAVGIIGNGDHPANLIFFAVVAVALAGALWSRLQPRRLARAMAITASVQAMACVAALIFDGVPVFAITCVFLGLWLASAQMFRLAARRETVHV